MESAHSIIETDAVVIGAGPVGLFQVFELGLLGIKAHVIDASTQPGGQCFELYPDKLIYDIPGIPSCTGRELIANLLQQIRPFHASFHLGETVAMVQHQDDGRFRVETCRETQFLSRTVFIAAGVGAFEARKIPLEGLAKYTGTQLFYHPPATTLDGEHVVIVGGDDEALDCALRYAEDKSERPASITLVHRRTEINTAPIKLEHMHALCRAQKMRFIAGQITGLAEQGARLQALIVSHADSTEEELPTDRLLVRLGRSPKLGPIANWGIALERKQVLVDTAHFESGTAGLFAIGDINTYPGKKKLILCGFHEATLAAFAAARYVFPHQTPQTLLYTTSSPQLHSRLGITQPT